jgi:hypothetical protein
LGLDKRYLTVVQLLPGYLPMNRIKVEISSFISNKWIFTTKPNDYEENDLVENRLLNIRNKALCRSYFGCCKTPLTMDERIIESGLEVLEFTQKSKMVFESEKNEKAFRDSIKEGQIHLMRQHDKIEQKLDQLLNRKFDKSL